AVKNGTLESLQAAMAASPSMPRIAAPFNFAVRRGWPATPARDVCECLMSEPQIEAKEVRPGRREWTDVLAASDCLVAVDADFRVEPVISGARPEIVSAHLEPGTRDTVARDPRDEVRRKRIAQRNLAELEEARVLYIGRQSG